MTSVPTQPPSIEDGWLGYRTAARLLHTDTAAVRTARVAYYAGTSHILALLTETGLDPDLVELLLSELSAFVQWQAEQDAEAES